MIDLLIAGGGPAGLATAIHGALAGMKTVVIEPRAAPIDKACGEGVMPSGVAELQGIGVSVTGHRLCGIRYIDSRCQAEARFAGSSGLGVRRTALYAAMHRRAKDLGVEIVARKVTQVYQHVDRVEAAGLQARWLVAADGLHSPIRRALGLELTNRVPARYGLRRHFYAVPWTDFVEVYWSHAGEAYVTPVSDTMVGVAVLSSARRNYDGLLADFPALTARLSASDKTQVLGAGPMRQRARTRVAGRVLLVGDAAGYCDALTGEGIALALRAARTAVGCLRSGRPEAYERAWRAMSRRHRFLTQGLLSARRSPVMSRLIVPAAHRLPAAFRTIVSMLA